MPRTPRPELMALLADVKENPDDLTPWLILCDWLEEYGDEADQGRGEYSRLCFDKLGKKINATDWEKGERRRALYKQYHEAWFGPVKALFPEIHKGLLTVHTQTLLPYVRELDADREAWAWVGTLLIWDDLTRLMRPTHEWLVEGLTRFEVERDLGNVARITKFANWPALGRIPCLSLRIYPLTRTKAQILADSPHLGNVRELIIHHESRIYPQPDRPSDKKMQEILQILADRFGDGLMVTDY